MKNVFVGLLSILFIQFLANASTLSQNDVSILIPLPQPRQIDLLLQPTTVGQFGPILPSRLFEKLPPIDPFTREYITYSRLRVISIRIDPCFPMNAPAVGCQPQVRLIWQPILPAIDGKISTFDGTIHTFYNLSNIEFNHLIQKLELLKKSSGVTVTDEPLSVNPILLKKGLNSLYAKRLFNTLLSVLGEQKISRITFMQLSASSNVWTFGGFDMINGSLQPMQIPRTGGIVQAFANNVLDPVPSYFEGGVVPAPQGPDTFNLLLRNSALITPSDKDEVIEGTFSAARIENPLKHTANSIDCVSCHTAQPAKLWAIKQYPWLGLDLRSRDFTFNSNFNLTNTSTEPEKTTSIRAFGYDGNNPVINQRVINETAHVLELLQK